MGLDSLLSIIVPVFNGEKYIENTIKNLLSTSYQNLELLLIDDGSTDYSLKICKQYENLDSRIKVYHKNNGGVADARNYGIDRASGSYVGFCDQDDTVSPEMYKKMMERIQADGSEAAICGCYRKKQDGGNIIFERYTDTVLLKREIRDKLLFPLLFRGFAVYENKEIITFPSIWNCIISKKLIDENGLRFYSFVDHEDDLLLLIQLYLNANKVSTVSGIFYYWNTNMSSQTYKRRDRYIEDLEIRQKKSTEFAISVIKQHGIEEDIIKKYRYVLCCTKVLQMLDNMCLTREKLASKVKKIRENESVSFIQAKKIFVPPKKGYVRNMVIISLIRKRHFRAAYILNRIINLVRYFVEQHRLAEAIERCVKR